MMKCRCRNCARESVYENVKAAFMDGWDITDEFRPVCDDCLRATSSSKVNATSTVALNADLSFVELKRVSKKL